MNYARIGAFLYILWGLLHILAAYNVYALAMSIEERIIQARLL